MIDIEEFEVALGEIHKQAKESNDPKFLLDVLNMRLHFEWIKLLLRKEKAQKWPGNVNKGS